MSILIRNGTIVTANIRGDIHSNASILIENDRIASISSEGTTHDGGNIIDASGYVIIPGFVQTHIHLCQTLFRGLADDLELLEWLKNKIFPMESAHNENSMYVSAKLGIAELIRSGSTTILDMGSIHYEEEVIRAIGETGLRAFVGKAMMDVNDIFPTLCESTNHALRSTRELAERHHNSYNGRIMYAVAPRFVLSCSDSLLQGAQEMLSNFPGMLFHTHASENKNEIKAVHERCKMENIEFLHHRGLLSNRSCLAHCVHLNKNEMDILQSTETNVSHCPSSNLKLGSGVAPIPTYISRGINVTLGADGAPCNNSLNMFQEMRLASLIQKSAHGPTSMAAKVVFEMATRGGAKALGLEHEVGTIEVGKKADLVLLDLNRLWNPLMQEDRLFSSIVYSAGAENVDSVMIDGKWVYRKKELIGVDEHTLVESGAKELKNLLNRL